jgi:hypothetical protein
VVERAVLSLGQKVEFERKIVNNCTQNNGSAELELLGTIYFLNQISLTIKSHKKSQNTHIMMS